jgi:glyoxylase-like metal-dependent hydrolase (beta-lactamase superfamily II)
MIRERIADDVYIFTSRRYAQVTCGVVLTRDGAVMIDTMLFPEETRAVRDFVERKLGHQIRHLILTHYHADHTTGAYLLPHANIIGHALCRELLDTVGRQALQQARTQTSEFGNVQVILPTLVVRQGTLDLTFGSRVLRLMHMPGHSRDLMGVFISDYNLLFASDTLMPLPTFFDGDYDSLISSLQRIGELQPEIVVQGHGEVVLRGEVHPTIEDDIKYLSRLKSEVEAHIAEGLPRESLEHVTIEQCGKSRIPLQGLVAELHYANLYSLYDKTIAARQRG